jgi:acyl-CoA synthetase (AMP-forming)/AMP-acid ligase II/acyl carrier protein
MAYRHQSEQGGGALRGRIAQGTLVARARVWAERRPEATAYTFLKDGEIESDALTFADVDRRARAIAATLQARHATSDRALLLYPPGLDFVAAFLGCLYAGTIAVPVNPPRPNRSPDTLQAIAADARATIALSTSAWMTGASRRTLELPELSRLEWIPTDQIDPRAQDAWHAPQVDGDSLAFLQYTSGSTSAPKGVMVSHANLFENERMVEFGFGHDDTTRFVSWLPVYHDMGLIGMLLQPLYLGIQCVLMPPAAFLQRPRRWLEAITRYRATTSGAPNFAYDLCARKIGPDQLDGLDLSTWTVAYNGAEPVRSDTLDRFTAVFERCGFRHAAFYPCYGLAEGTLIVSGGRKLVTPVVTSVDRQALESHTVRPPATPADQRTVVSCGTSLLEGTIAIVQPESRTEATSSEVGEIWVAGPSVACGYWNKPEETDETFGAMLADGRGPFLRTGDLGFKQDGQLFVTGRSKDLVIIAGQNHYPHDIELTAERSHPDLTPGAVVAFSIDREGTERLVVVAEVDRRHRRVVDGAVGRAIAAAVRAAIAEAHEIEVHALALVGPGVVPKTSSGKLQRALCRSMFVSGALLTVAVIETAPAPDDASPAASPSGAPSRGAIEAWLVAELARQVGANPSTIDVRAPFARYGVSSLMAVSITSDLGLWLNRDLDATLFWDYPSIEALARFLAPTCASAR